MEHLLTRIDRAIRRKWRAFWLLDLEERKSARIRAQRKQTLQLEREVGLLFYGVILLPGYWHTRTSTHFRHNYVLVPGYKGLFEVGRDNEASPALAAVILEMHES